MKTNPLTTSFGMKKFGSTARLLLSALSIMTFFSVAPALADAGDNNNLVTNAQGNIDDTNPNYAFHTRQNYGKRFPFMWDAFNKDKLENINVGTAQKQSNANASGGSTQQSNGEKGGGSNSDNTNQGGADTNQPSNVKKSAAWKGMPHTQVVYDLMVQPMGQPGHYLPGALPNHLPQYGSMADAECIQYAQPQLTASDKPLTERDRELFDNQLQTFAVPISDTQFQVIDREDKNRFLELAFDPERLMWAATTLSQLQGNNMSNALAGSSEAAWRQATTRITAADGNAGGGGAGGTGGAQVGALINIANEQSGVPTAADNPWKTVPQAVWMVQQMYKFVFVPLAILFLLPGAVMTQVKAIISNGFRLNAEDQSSPFEGILRSVIAIFLIPATQLIVSYSIDVGNSMAYSVKDWVDLELIWDWSKQLTYNTPINSVDNALLPPNAAAGGDGTNAGANSGSDGGGFFSSVINSIGSLFGSIGQAIASWLTGGGGDGLGANTPETSTIAERQLWLSNVLELMFNMATYIMSSAVIVLGAYQLVFICYLYLLGPLSAAFYAWPKIQNPNSQQNLFRDVWANWLNAVITVCLWRFYWMVLLAIMTQRILYLQDSGVTSDLQWEVAVFTCLLGLMMYVPFNPWNFDPAAAFSAVQQSGQAMMQGASGAMGQAAKAAGVPASAVQGMQNQVSQALQPMQSIQNAWNMANYGVNNPMNPDQAGLGAQSAQMGGQNTGQNAGSAPPLQTMASPMMAAASPQSSSPPGGNPGGPAEMASSPPNMGGGNAGMGGAQSPNVQLAQASANPGTQVGQMNEPTVPLSPSNNGTTFAANPNASAGDITAGTQQANQIASAVSPGASIPGSNGGGSIDAGAISNPPSSAQLASASTGSGGGSNDLQAAGTAAALANVTGQSGNKNEPPTSPVTQLASNDKPTNPDSSPPPTIV